MNGKHAYFQTIPKYLMEISIIFIFLITFLVFDFFQLNIKELLTFSSLVLVASLKIMPALSRIISSFQSIQYSSPSLILLKKQIDDKNIEIISKEEIIFERSIKLNNLSFKFENSKNTLNQINNEIKKNEITGIVGKNGSGKSTLINIIMGLIKIDNNMLFVDDKNVNLQNSNWYKKISYVSNKSFLLDTNIENNIVFEIKGKNIDRKKLEYAIDFLELDKVFEDFPDGLKTEIGHNGSKISSGQKQKICLARAFYHDSEILIFDEATNSMDEEGERNFFNKLLRLKKQKTIIIVSHDSKNLSLCDRIISLN
jgi:ABC-type transport system involved in cytochrome bd biosynthesis fused ATPase/permease subunit